MPPIISGGFREAAFVQCCTSQNLGQYVSQGRIPRLNGQETLGIACGVDVVTVAGRFCVQLPDAETLVFNSTYYLGTSWTEQRRIIE